MTCTLTVLGCSGGIAQGLRTTSFLLNHDTLIDCGTGVGDLTLDQLKAIDRVFLTHSHLDHITCLPLMLDAVGSDRQQPLVVYALSETLAALKTHVFNNVIWPDFTRIPTPEAPWVRLHPVSVGETIAIPRSSVTVLPACHSIPAVSYAINSDNTTLVFTGDTGPCPAFWDALKQVAPTQAKHLLVEVSFTNADQALAKLSGHYCPHTLAEAIHLNAPDNLSIWISHLKPGSEQLILDEIHALSSKPTTPLAHGQQILF